MSTCRAMVVHAEMGDLFELDQPGLQSKLKDSQDYRETCLEKPKRKMKRKRKATIAFVFLSVHVHMCIVHGTAFFFSGVATDKLPMIQRITLHLDKCEQPSVNSVGSFQKDVCVAGGLVEKKKDPEGAGEG